MKQLSGILLFLLGLANSAWAFNAYSNEELDQLEKEFVQLINQSDEVDRQPLAREYINHLGKKLAQTASMPSPDFFIVKSNEINAFAGPGGHIGINSQLILTTRNESELAAVMAHEIAHVRQHHLYRMLEHQKQMRIPMLASVLASIALGVINPVLGESAMMASMTGIAQDGINYVRSGEKEADRIGIDMLSRANFNPKSMSNFFRKMQESSRYYYTDNIPAILRSHPLDEDRIAEADNRIARMGSKSYNESEDYPLFKEMIRTDVSRNDKQLLEFYQKLCSKVNTEQACEYGRGLVYIKINQFSKAKEILNPLVMQNPGNLYFQIALSQAETGLKEFEAASKRLSDLLTSNPDNYALLMAYAESLQTSDQPDKAATILLKGSRAYPKDLPLCRELARAESNRGRKGYAYFTQAQCLILEGRGRNAITQLKVAKDYAKKDEYLLARIDAKIDELKFMLAK